ncbi:MAG: ABC transporter permease subunit [Pseudomonadales bacterium]|jgi:oligopeptide transport system permease protein|nr:ABC transporter permease subunit [Pseudomonadales bacterium]MCP5320346.1 ABC transporter permease subunit [Pseudomonadales bacterium]MCP5337978.1 ABC transporter permease subunit [Pseudomonadales bacterium]
MLRYLLRRLPGGLGTLLVIATLAFAMLHSVPGGPFDSEKPMLPEIREAMLAKYHLDEPLWRQYLRYLSDLAHGDLGPSFQYRGTTVNEIIAQGFPVDVTIGLSALLIALLAGSAIGLYAALYHNSRRDHALMALAVVGISVPLFVIAPILILVFAIELRWLPPGGWVSGSLPHLVLPALALALPYTAYIARLMRASTLEVLASPFIRTARAKGLPLHTIMLRHALRPTLLPIVSFLGPAIAGVITGSIIIETVFALPGIGRYFTVGALNRDYTLVMGITILYGALIIVCNLLVDLSYALLDPRVRTQR